VQEKDDPWIRVSGFTPAAKPGSEEGENSQGILVRPLQVGYERGKEAFPRHSQGQTEYRVGDFVFH
jgi:hypothetical protein